MLGPTVGGKLAKRYDSYYVPFTVAFILFLFNSFLIRIALPPKLRNANSKREVIPTENVPSKKTSRSTFLGQFASLEPALRNLLLIRLLLAAGVMLGRNNLFNLLEYKHTLDVEEKGELISFFCRGKRAITTSYHCAIISKLWFSTKVHAAFVFFFDKRRFCCTCILFCKGYIYALFGLHCGMFVSCTSQHVYAIDTGCR